MSDLDDLREEVGWHTGYIDMHEERLRKLEALHDAPAEGLAAEGHSEAILNVVLKLIKKHGRHSR